MSRNVTRVTWLTLTILGTIWGQVDKRCFLEGGWSTISFFVR